MMYFHALAIQERLNQPLYQQKIVKIFSSVTKRVWRVPQQLVESALRSMMLIH
jgi:hypothetical protein